MKYKYIQLDTNPKIYHYHHSEERIHTIINCFALFENTDWKEAYQHYLDTLHETCCGPDDNTLPTRMLRLSCFHSTRNNLDFQKGILCRNKYYWYLERKDETIYIYGIFPKGPNFVHDTDQIYVQKDYIKNVGKKENRNEMYNKAVSIQLYNENPKGKLVGDCLIRGIASVTQKSWHETVDELGKIALQVNQIQLNSERVFSFYLANLGFTRHPQLTIHNKPLLMPDFCEHVGQTYKNEPILAYSGKGHVVALLPVNGTYKIQDTWDSSHRFAGYYFVKEERKEKSIVKKNISTIKKDDYIIHPLFGKGRIRAIHNNECSIEFSNHFNKRFKKSWVLQNCKKII